VTRIAVLGIGNTLMGDDGAGAAVVRELSCAGLGEEVAILQRPNADMGALRYFLESDAVIVVDALEAGSEPGAVFRFTPDEAGITSLRSNNIHGMGVGHLVTNARLSGADPYVVVLAIQIGTVDPNADTLSPAVAEAIPHVAEMVRKEVAGLLSG
jgi:hydrogenase maturation protease